MCLPESVCVSVSVCVCVCVCVHRVGAGRTGIEISPNQLCNATNDKLSSVVDLR